MLKVKPHPEYPPETGRYLCQNDYPTVAFTITFTTDPKEVPPEIEQLVRTGMERGTAISGTIKITNIGIERITCTIITSLDIRCLIPGDSESEGYKTGAGFNFLVQ